MAKLYFRYGTMDSAKTLNMLAVAHNYRKQGKSVKDIKPWPRYRYLTSPHGLLDLFCVLGPLIACGGFILTTYRPPNGSRITSKRNQSKSWSETFSDKASVKGVTNSLASTAKNGIADENEPSAVDI